jgi:hypothetical protein
MEFGRRPNECELCKIHGPEKHVAGEDCVINLPEDFFEHPHVMVGIDRVLKIHSVGNLGYQYKKYHHVLPAGYTGVIMIDIWKFSKYFCNMALHEGILPKKFYDDLMVVFGAIYRHEFMTEKPVKWETKTSFIETLTGSFGGIREYIVEKSPLDYHKREIHPTIEFLSSTSQHAILYSVVEEIVLMKEPTSGLIEEEVRYHKLEETGGFCLLSSFESISPKSKEQYLGVAEVVRELILYSWESAPFAEVRRGTREVRWLCTASIQFYIYGQDTIVKIVRNTYGAKLQNISRNGDPVPIPEKLAKKISYYLTTLRALYCHTIDQYCDLTSFHWYKDVTGNKLYLTSTNDELLRMLMFVRTKDNLNLHYPDQFLSKITSLLPGNICEEVTWNDFGEVLHTYQAAASGSISHLHSFALYISTRANYSFWTAFALLSGRFRIIINHFDDKYLDRRYYDMVYGDSKFRGTLSSNVPGAFTIYKDDNGLFWQSVKILASDRAKLNPSISIPQASFCTSSKLKDCISVEVFVPIPIKLGGFFGVYSPDLFDWNEHTYLPFCPWQFHLVSKRFGENKDLWLSSVDFLSDPTFFSQVESDPEVMTLDDYQFIYMASEQWSYVGCYYNRKLYTALIFKYDKWHTLVRLLNGYSSSNLLQFGKLCVYLQEKFPSRVFHNKIIDGEDPIAVVTVA